MTTELIKELVGLAVEKNKYSIFKVEVLVSERTVEVLLYEAYAGSSRLCIDRDNSNIIDLLHFEAHIQLQAAIDKVKSL